MNRKFREGHIYRVVAQDHHSDTGPHDETTITVVGAFIGKVRRNRRSWVQLAAIFHDDGPGWIIAVRSSVTNLIEAEIVSVKDLGRAR